MIGIYCKVNPTVEPLYPTLHTLIDLYHGDTVALKTYTRGAWLGCSTTPCQTATCPGEYIEGSDWSNCWGEVFQIYKPVPGIPYILSGDFVAFHYPREAGKWLGCSNSECQKASCPGQPTIEFGFSSRDQWRSCWGELFVIYGYGKKDATEISSGDKIMLYHYESYKWVNGHGIIDKTTCPGNPPLETSKFELCPHEVFRIMKRY